MGNLISKTAACYSSKSVTSFNMDDDTFTQMSLPRSPGFHDLSACESQQTSRCANEAMTDDEIESGITHPTPARPLIRRYSELIDPAQLDNLQIRSPSGNMLTGSRYNLRDDRPLSVRERQERIRQQIIQKKQEQEMAHYNGRKRDSAKITVKKASAGTNKKRKTRFGCFGV
ncbi:hypothetical protein KCU81_g4692, partial [Aureobasidium melanogenum]|uniref:Uncharacterized protein n=1 Tax=Aureobasidium melanogenum (strain CBS 110374) TaxID=1043003 RepID=A0A074WN49_AURM1